MTTERRPQATVERFFLRALSAQRCATAEESACRENFTPAVEQSKPAEQAQTRAPAMDHLAQYFHAVETSRWVRFLEDVHAARMARNAKASCIAQAYASND